MPYLIDGHNLIAKLPGISLEQIDDERRLIELLRQFVNRQGQQVTVYFDRGMPGVDNPRSQGGVRAHFVRPPRTADEAIADHLDWLGGAAKNWTVISSDNKVLAAARRAGARRMTSEAFARELRPTPASPEEPEKPPPPKSDEEIEAWLRLFGEGDED